MFRSLATRRGCLTLFTLVILTVSAAVGATAPIRADAPAAAPDPDYTVGSVEAFDYYNSRGLQDTNGDGRVVLAVEGELNMSESRDSTIRYDGDEPLSIRGGGFANVTAPFVVAETDARVSLRSTSITGVAAETPSYVVAADGPVDLRNVSLRDTVHQAAYGTEIFDSAHRVGAVSAGGSVTIVASNLSRTGAVVRAEGDVTVVETRINDTDAGEAAIRSEGRVRLDGATVSHVIGARGGAVQGDSVVATATAFRAVDAGVNGGGGAISSGGPVRLVDTAIVGAYAGREGGAVVGGDITVRNSTIRDATAGQGSSVFSRGDNAVTMSGSHLDAVGPVVAGRSTFEGRIAVSDSSLQRVRELRAGTVAVANATADGGLAIDAQSLSVRDSELRDVDRWRSDEGHIQSTTIRGSGTLDIGDLVVRESVLVEVGRIDAAGSVEMSNTTVYGAPTRFVPETGSQSFEAVNFIEMESPVFAGRLPDRETVFVDTTNDTEAYGAWDADVFSSTDEPFPSVVALAPELVATPTSTPEPTATATPATTPTTTTIPTTTTRPTESSTGPSTDRNYRSTTRDSRDAVGGPGSDEVGGIFGVVPWYVFFGIAFVLILLGLFADRE
jgi:hypothetical protein